MSSRSTPDCVFGQDPHEDVPVCGKGVQRNDCSAILSKGCITALLSESSPEVGTYPSHQLISMGEKAGNNNKRQIVRKDQEVLFRIKLPPYFQELGKGLTPGGYQS